MHFSSLSSIVFSFFVCFYAAITLVVVDEIQMNIKINIGPTYRPRHLVYTWQYVSHHSDI